MKWAILVEILDRQNFFLWYDYLVEDRRHLIFSPSVACVFCVKTEGGDGGFLTFTIVVEGCDAFQLVWHDVDLVSVLVVGQTRFVNARWLGHIKHEIGLKVLFIFIGNRLGPFSVVDNFSLFLSVLVNIPNLYFVTK